MNTEEKNMISHACDNASYWNSAKNIFNEGMACGGLTSNMDFEKWLNKIDGCIKKIYIIYYILIKFWIYVLIIIFKNKLKVSFI